MTDDNSQPPRLGKQCFSFEEVAEIKRHAILERPYADRVSIVLAFRLLGYLGQMQERFEILLELDYLEGLRHSSRTKTAEPFRKPPLSEYPLLHKHFFSTHRHLIRNIGIRWALDRNGNRELDALIHEVAEQHGHDAECWPKMLSHRLIVSGYEERACKGLTGDWIIYTQHEGRNYYLDIAAHQEGENPDELLKKLRNGCQSEFPFAFVRNANA